MYCSPNEVRNGALFEHSIGFDRNVKVFCKNTSAFQICHTYLKGGEERAERVVRINQKSWQLLWENKEEIDRCISKMKKKEPVCFQMQLSEDVVLRVKSGSYCIDLRKYQRSPWEAADHASEEGVSLKFAEWSALMRLSSVLNRLLLGM